MAQVMIIEDDPMVSRFLEEHLAVDGHEAKSYAMAEEAFQAAVQSPPDLFLVDVMLPDATGFQMVGRFRQHPATREVPIIMMSGTARHANQIEIGKGMGANEYLVKPIDTGVMTEKIQKLLAAHPKKGSVVPLSGSEAPLQETPAPSSAPAPEEAPSIEGPQVLAPEIPALEEPTPVPSEASINGDSQEFQLPDFGYKNSPEADTPLQPGPLETPKARPSASHKTRWALVVLASHMVLAVVQGFMANASGSAIARAASGIAAGWMLLLGLLVGASGMLGIILRADEALGLLVWPAIPILGRALAATAGFKLDPRWATPELYWIRPLDIFEMAAILTLGISLRRKPGSSVRKVILVCFLIALGWCLTNRGYFQP